MATVILRPDAAGDETNLVSQWPLTGSHYDKVDESVADDDTTRLAAGDKVTYKRDLYKVGATAVRGVISKIGITVRCYAGSAIDQASIKIAVKTREGGGVPTDAYESAAKTVTASDTWEDFTEEWANNPKSSAAWDWDEIENLQIGIALRSYDSGTAYNTWCTQVYVTVTYTAGVAPTVTTSPELRIAKTRASGIGNVTALGDAAVTQHGHCWGTTNPPYVADSKTTLGSKGATGAFRSNSTGMSADTTYYTRAYATNTNGNSYGAVESFTTEDKGTEFPSLAITRVTNLIHRYSPGHYTLELALGEVTSDFGLPDLSTEPRSAWQAAPVLPPELISPPPSPPTSTPPPPTSPPPPAVPPEYPGEVPPEWAMPSEVADVIAEREARTARARVIPERPFNLRDWIIALGERLGIPGVPEYPGPIPSAKVTDIRPFVGVGALSKWMEEQQRKVAGRSRAAMLAAIAEREARAEQARRRAKTRRERGRTAESKRAAEKRKRESASGRWRFT